MPKNKKDRTTYAKLPEDQEVVSASDSDDRELLDAQSISYDPELVNNLNNAPQLSLTTQDPFLQLAELKDNHFLAEFFEFKKESDIPLLSREQTVGLNELITLGNKLDFSNKVLDSLNQGESAYNSIRYRYSRVKDKMPIILGTIIFLGSFFAILGQGIYSYFNDKNIEEYIDGLIDVIAAHCSDYLFYAMCDVNNVCHKTFDPTHCTTSYGMNKTLEYTFADSTICNATCTELIATDTHHNENLETQATIFTWLYIAMISPSAIVFLSFLMSRLVKPSPEREKSAKEILSKSAKNIDELIHNLTSQDIRISLDKPFSEVKDAVISRRMGLFTLFNNQMTAIKDLRDYGIFSERAKYFISCREKVAETKEEKKDTSKPSSAPSQSITFDMTNR